MLHCVRDYEDIITSKPLLYQVRSHIFNIVNKASVWHNIIFPHESSRSFLSLHWDGRDVGQATKEASHKSSRSFLSLHWDGPMSARRRKKRTRDKFAVVVDRLCISSLAESPALPIKYAIWFQGCWNSASFALSGRWIQPNYFWLRSSR